jgi:hypothetical protein
LKFRFVFIFFFLVFCFWFFNQSEEGSKISAKNYVQNYIQKIKSFNKLSASSMADSSDSIILEKLRIEAENVGKIDSAPQETEEKLQNWARSMSASDLTALKATAINVKSPQDERFLAVMLMSWSQKPSAAEHLKDIALSRFDPLLINDRGRDFEKILRMQAVDGLSDLPPTKNSLQDIIKYSPETYLVDRAHRNQWALQGNAQKPKAQDEVALEALLKKRNKNN